MLTAPGCHVDLDDVENYFTTSLANMLGAPVKPGDYDAYLQKVGQLATTFDLVAQFNTLFPGRHYTYESLWDSVTAEMWASIQISDEAVWLLDLCAGMVGRENVFLLTAPIDPQRASEKAVAACVSGKMTWVKKNLPTWMHGRCQICAFKAEASAAPHKLLIDDSPRNIKAWQAHNGASLTWPRPWNDEPEQTRSQIVKRIGKWCNHATALCTQLHVA